MRASQHYHWFLHNTHRNIDCAWDKIIDGFWSCAIDEMAEFWTRQMGGVLRIVNRVVQELMAEGCLEVETSIDS